jgi:flagellar basal-body rod protein FlgB
MEMAGGQSPDRIDFGTLENKSKAGGTRRAGAGPVVDLFSGVMPLHAALDYHLERHNILSSNIAHVDTPGYKPKDLARVEEGSFDQVLGVTMERTSAAHLAAGSSSSDDTGRVFTDATAGGGADGNYVSLEREAGKLASNQIRYDIVSVLVSSELKGLLWAANDGKAG